MSIYHGRVSYHLFKIEEESVTRYGVVVPNGENRSLARTRLWVRVPPAPLNQDYEIPSTIA